MYLCVPICFSLYVIVTFSFSKQRHTINLPRRVNDNEFSQNRQNVVLQQHPRGRSTLGYTFGKNSDDERRRKDSSGNNPNTVKLQRVLCPDEARVMQRANQIVQYVPPDYAILI